MRAFISGDLTKVGDAYVDGRLTVDGKIDDVVEAGIAFADRIGGLVATKAALSFHRLVARGRRREDARDIRSHYDVSNEFYRLWLGERMIYSCAYFRLGNEDIDSAQEQKLEHVCRKLALKPGERLLDVGCGWGGLLEFAARRYDIEGVGVTLSENQYAFMREMIAREGLEKQIEVCLRHYRDFVDEEGFDKIVSIGMYEHVGVDNWRTYFGSIARLLRPGGAFLNHGVIATDPHGESHGPDFGDFIARHVFPGGAIAHLSRTVYEIADAGLELADIEDLRPHYARTLRCWSRRLESRAAEAIACAGPERFRIWDTYLAGMAYAFDRGWLSVAQALAYKPGSNDWPAIRPWTREHQYSDGAAVLTEPRQDRLKLI
nr:cyclopropane-fatty-acyl-phospholipid synthase family protein [Methylosinus sp. KRF6]